MIKTAKAIAAALRLYLIVTHGYIDGETSAHHAVEAVDYEHGKKHEHNIIK